MDPCPHRPPCPGCPRFGQVGPAADALSALDALCAEAGIVRDRATTGAATGFRHRARLAVRGRTRSPKIGIFELGSHRIVDIPNCLVHHPRINRVASAVKAAIRTTGVVPYLDDDHLGQLRYVQLVVERSTQRVQLVLVGRDTTPQPLAPLAEVLQRTLGDVLHSIWWNGQPDRNNTILGPHWHRWYGTEAVRESIGGAAVFFPPGAFGQSHLDLADQLVAQAHAWIPDGARVLELYAGCGPIGLGTVARAAQVTFNEVSPDGLAGLRMGIATLPAVWQSRTAVLEGPAPMHAAAIRDADVVVVDPPRKGLDAEVLDALLRDPPARLVAVSCDLDAFLREARALLDGGRLALRAVRPIALFPHSEHLETMALFERR